MKQSIGNDYISEAESFLRLDELSKQFNIPSNTLTKELVMAWIEKRPHEKALTQSKRINGVKALARYMKIHGHDAYVYPFTPQSHTDVYIPHIFSEREMAVLISLSDSYPATPTAPCLGMVVPLFFKILYGCGLRTSELLNLRVVDVDIQNDLLHITGSKFGKSRLVPMAHSLSVGCAEYLTQAGCQHGGESFLIQNQFGNRYGCGAPYYWFRNLLSSAGIPHGGKGQGPRLHDIRHTFAVHRLKKWVIEGRDINSMLPILSAYMGHCDLRGTQIYLRLTADLFPDIVGRMESFFSGHEEGGQLDEAD